MSEMSIFFFRVFLFFFSRLSFFFRVLYFFFFVSCIFFFLIFFFLLSEVEISCSFLFLLLLRLLLAIFSFFFALEDLVALVTKNILQIPTLDPLCVVVGVGGNFFVLKKDFFRFEVKKKKKRKKPLAFNKSSSPTNII